MPKSVPYRCVLCKRTAKGKPGMTTCPDCGGHLVALQYGKTKARTRGR